MEDFKKNKQLFDELKGLAQKYNVCFVTATQPQRPKSDWPAERVERPNNLFDVIIVDHFPLIGH
jgi:hypothetical protein